MNTELLDARLPPAHDRMLTTCFLAAVFHGIVILGVTFSASNSDAGGPEAPALEVVLVGNRGPNAGKNPDAHYIAERTQQGSGSTLHDERTLIPRSSAASLDQAGTPGGEGLASLEGAPDPGADAILATRAPSSKILYFSAPNAAALVSTPAQLLEKRPDLGIDPTDDGVLLRMRGAPKDQLWVTADTKQSDVAVYLDGWRRKIERVGTLNFPDVARRRKLSGTPVIEVTIKADGRLLKASLRRSSGHPEIDEAAMRILKLAAPYDPFPRALNAKHDLIRIAYEWQFLGGEVQESGLLYAEPGGAAPGAGP